MTLPTREEARTILEQHVTDEYQRFHALMVATVLAGYAKKFGADPDLWYATGYLHDVDFQEFPDTHPAPSLEWFAQWGYPEELIHAVEAHAYGYNGFSTEPRSKLAAALIACDEVCGIFYAYRKLNPLPYGDMKPSSIVKRIKEKAFAPKIERETIYRGVEWLGIPLEEHVANMVAIFKETPPA
jgi:predicted hydrolase (HD superfamily)